MIPVCIEVFPFEKIFRIYASDNRLLQYDEEGKPYNSRGKLCATMQEEYAGVLTWPNGFRCYLLLKASLNFQYDKIMLLFDVLHLNHDMFILECSGHVNGDLISKMIDLAVLNNLTIIKANKCHQLSHLVRCPISSRPHFTKKDI